MIERRVERPLTPVELLAVKGAIDEGEKPVDSLLGALKVTFNALLAEFGETWESYDATNRLDGKQYAIPREQWVQIGDWLRERSSLIEGVNLALDWMNVGPSAYEAAEVSR